MLLDTPPKPDGSRPALGAADWVDCALEQLMNNGVDAVQITQLAKGLRVTRGSFYWHFKSRKDLLDALLARWDMLNNVDFGDFFRECSTLDQSVLNFFKKWVTDERFNPPLDQAIRDWAQLDNDVLILVRQADTARINRISEMFERFGFGADEASVRARVLYFSQVGYAAINLGEAMTERLSLLTSYYYAHTGRSIDPDIAEAFAVEMRAF